MASASFTKNDGRFVFGDGLVAYSDNTNVATSESAWSWDTSATHVEFNGDDLAFQNGRPKGGIITSFGVDIGNDNGGTFEDYDLQITGLDLKLVDLRSLTDETLTTAGQENLIWRTVLAGNDTIDLGNNSNSTFDIGGDGNALEKGLTIHSGDDAISGYPGFNGDVSGDFTAVEAGAKLFGGNDKVTITDGNYAFGEAYQSEGYVKGGNDILTGAAREICGDVLFVKGTLFGGDDTIKRTFAGFAEGDGSYVSGNVVGGDDKITGSNGNDIVAADVNVITGGKFTGGNDVIHGRNGDDGITGDWVLNGIGSKAVGGNDKLYGDAGNDTLYGTGGDDVLDGGTGMDFLDGGTGKDKLTGGTDSDHFVIAKGNSTDVITDFAFKGKDHDWIEVDGTGTAKVSVNENGDVVISLNKHDTLTLEDVSAKQFDKHFIVHETPPEAQDFVL